MLNIIGGLLIHSGMLRFLERRIWLYKGLKGNGPRYRDLPCLRG